MSFWHIVVEAFFAFAIAFAVWSIVRTIREAWPRIKELMEELGNDT